MANQSATKTITSITLATALGIFLWKGDWVWDKTIIYLLHAMLAIFFFAVLVSNQQREEDAIAKLERTTSAVLFSYALFIQALYVPMARYFFGQLIQQRFFLSDVLALLLFLLFLFLFGTSAMVLNSYARFGFLSQWTFFNSPTAYFVLRNLWLAAVLLAVFLFWQMPFVIITV
jgi:hypothetical protein